VVPLPIGCAEPEGTVSRPRYWANRRAPAPVARAYRAAKPPPETTPALRPRHRGWYPCRSGAQSLKVQSVGRATGRTAGPSPGRARVPRGKAPTRTRRCHPQHPERQAPGRWCRASWATAYLIAETNSQSRLARDQPGSLPCRW